MSRRHRHTLSPAPTTIRAQAAVSALIDSALVKPRAGLTGGAATDRLADDMRQASQREGGISRDELEALGWTHAQLETLGSAARVKAQRLAGATV
jgi:hypothetical protein